MQINIRLSALHMLTLTYMLDERFPEQMATYHISQTIRRTSFPEKCDLNSTCVLYAEGKYHISWTVRCTFSQKM